MHYPSKLLLFGEYLIIKSGEALAIPFEKYGGKWGFAPEQPGLQQDLAKLVVYLSKLQTDGKLLANLDTTKFSTDIKKGLFFESNIPTGYGLGSSGALCAGIYDRYAREDKISRANTTQYCKLKAALAQIESFFHGKSSGIDPLVSYTRQPIFIKKDKTVEAVQLPNTSFSFFLLDTNMSRQTSPLVEIFLDKWTNPVFEQAINEKLIPVSDQAISTVFHNKKDSLIENFQAISFLQYTHFQEMIPEAFRCIWRVGLESDDFYLKLCGAGGGGFLLGIVINEQNAQEALKGFSIQKV